MRSSKSRSRSKSNRSRSVGNIVNRVFDSSGPEGKVRGTPQQIIDKYNQLARDAQLSNDRVAAENFQQHAEHYTRMLAEAQREQEARREQQDNQNRDRQQPNGTAEPRNDPPAEAQSQPQPQSQSQPARPEQSPKSTAPEAPPETTPDTGDSPNDVIDMGGPDADTGLVETPESKPAPRRRGRPRKSEAKTSDAAPDDGSPKAAE